MEVFPKFILQEAWWGSLRVADLVGVSLLAVLAEAEAEPAPPR